MTPWHFRIIFAEVGLVLLIATFRLPFDFYRALRLVVAVAGILLIVRAKQTQKLLWWIPAAVGILLFTPVFGFEFPKETWIPIDAALGITFLVSAVVLGKTPTLVDGANDALEFDSQEPDEHETSTDGNKLLSLVLITLCLGAIFLVLGTHVDASSSCPNWVSDAHGGYCEG
jgi:hypothetical protein